MERVFHVSETAGIERFEPRTSRDGSAYVWAVGESRLQNYLFPRDCPRVTFYAAADTTEEDRSRLLGETSAEFVLAIERSWLPAMVATTLHVYEFESTAFRLYDAIAAYYVSEEQVRPVACRTVANLLEELVRFDVELRVLPSLWRLREAVIHSSVGFSIIRFRNASPPPEGVDAYHPLS